MRARLAEHLPPLDLVHLAGRIAFERSGARYAITARELSFVAPDGVRVVPADIALRYELGNDGETRSGRIAASHLELAPLTALAAHLPLPNVVREHVARHAPRGTLTEAAVDWEGPLAQPVSFRTRGTFHDLGIRAHESLPGFTRLVGCLRGDRARRVAAPVEPRRRRSTCRRCFFEPLVLDTASGRVRWDRDDGGVHVRLEDVEFANADAAGKASGTWSSRPKGPGFVDLTARLTRGDVRRVHAYLPRTISAQTRHWVRDSLLAGTAEEGEVAIKGDLARFPFPGGRDGKFLMTAKARDVLLDYANGWPVINGIDADVRFEGPGLTVAATRGRVLGTAIARTKATMPDLVIEHPLLVVEGEASGPTAEFLRFVETSPVAAWIDRCHRRRAVDGQRAPRPAPRDASLAAGGSGARRR